MPDEGGSRPSLMRGGRTGDFTSGTFGGDASTKMFSSSTQMGLGKGGDGLKGLDEKTRKQAAKRATIFTGQNFNNLLEKLQTNASFGKIASGRAQACTVEEVHEMFLLFDVADKRRDGIVDIVQLQAVLEQALEEGDIKDSIFRAITFAQRNHHLTDDTMGAADFLQVLLLGSPDDVKKMSLKLHGLDEEKSFVLRETLINYLVKKKDQNDNCKAMPVTIIFFCLIFYMVTSHLSISIMFELNDAVSSIKSKDIKNKFPDLFWKHFEGLIGSPYVAHNNKILGGMRVSRKAAEGEPDGPLCQYSPWNYLWDDIRTGGKSSDEPAPLEVCHKVTTPSSWLHWVLRPEDALLRFNTGLTPKVFCERLQAKHKLNNYSSASDRVKSILNRTDCPKLSVPGSTWATSEVFDLVRSDTGEKHRPVWYSTGRRTGTLQLESITHNGRLGFYSFKRILVEIQESGAATASTMVESFTDNPVWTNFDEDIKSRLDVIIVDFVFLFFYIYTALHLLYNIFRTLRYGHFMSFLKDFWVKVEILNIFLVFMILIGYFHCVYLTGGLNLLKESLPVPLNLNNRYNTAQWERYIGKPLNSYEEQVHGVLDQASRVAQSFKDLRWYITVFCFCSCMRFLKVFRANEKLNVVWKTVVQAGSDLLHFLMVFMALCMAFVLVIHVLCGSQIDQFADLNVSTNTVLLFLLGYVFDDVWAPMVESGNKLAIIWSVLFMIMMVLISLNMVLAIIFDVYADVKAQAANDPSLIQQIAAFWTEGKKRSDARRGLRELDEPGAEPDGDDAWSNAATEATRRSRPSATPEANDDFNSSTGSKGLGARMSAAAEAGIEEFKHEVEVLEEEAQHAAHAVSMDHLQNKILDSLRVKDLHPQSMVTPDSLMEALNLHSASNHDNVEELILAAAKHSEYENKIQEMSMTNNARLIQRIDQNMRELIKDEADLAIRSIHQRNKKVAGFAAPKRVEKFRSSGSLAKRVRACVRIQKIWRKSAKGQAATVHTELFQSNGKFVAHARQLSSKVGQLEQELELLAATAAPIMPTILWPQTVPAAHPVKLLKPADVQPQTTISDTAAAPPMMPKLPPIADPKVPFAADPPAPPVPPPGPPRPFAPIPPSGPPGGVLELLNEAEAVLDEGANSPSAPAPAALLPVAVPSPALPPPALPGTVQNPELAEVEAALAEEGALAASAPAPAPAEAPPLVTEGSQPETIQDSVLNEAVAALAEEEGSHPGTVHILK